MDRRGPCGETGFGFGPIRGRLGLRLSASSVCRGPQSGWPHSAPRREGVSPLPSGATLRMTASRLDRGAPRMIQTAVAALGKGNGHSLRTASWLESWGALGIRHHQIHAVGIEFLRQWRDPGLVRATRVPRRFGGFMNAPPPLNSEATLSCRYSRATAGVPSF